jgi:hypothetical protein
MSEGSPLLEAFTLFTCIQLFTLDTFTLHASLIHAFT